MSALNPVLVREMRSRMRGRRAAVLITFWLAFNGLVLTIVYLAAENAAEQQFGFGDFANTVTIGRGVFQWSLFGMLLLMLLIVPAQAAGAIAGERERQTLIPLQITLLSPRQILLGKLAASVAFLVLLVVAGLPLLAVGYLVGGVTVADVLTGAAVVLLTGLLVAGMCIAISTFVRRVQAATVLCYALVLVLTIGTLMAYGAYAIVDTSRGVDSADPPEVLLLPNPVLFVSSVIGNESDPALGSPFDAMHQLVEPDNEFGGQSESVSFSSGQAFVTSDGVTIDARTGRVVDDGSDADLVPGSEGSRFWLASLGLLTVASVGALVLAARRLRTPAGTER